MPKHSTAERRSLQQLPASPARTRFAPSPTGYLHLGSLRTALFNYLTAKATGGQFILRIEDTDKRRFVHDAEYRLCQDLKWAGLQWDEGPDIGGHHGPYRQSERTSLYQSHGGNLLLSGYAYRCFCSMERLNTLAKERNALGVPADYDRTCANIRREESDDRASKGELHVVRLKVPDRQPIFTDIVYGLVGKSKENQKLHFNCTKSAYEDPILIKSDGLPTYHLANVVDDHDMGITHVIRASEWMSSTPKHIVMYEALGWKPPLFAHVGLLQDASRQKFSKRNMTFDIHSFQNEGFFAEALVNFVALFGWSHRLNHDYLSLQDLVHNFDLKFTKGNTIALPYKLLHLQKHYAQKYVEEGGREYTVMIDQLQNIVKQYLTVHPDHRICPDNALRARVASLLRCDAKNYTTPQDFFERNSQLFCSKPRKEYKEGPGDLLLHRNMDVIVHHFECTLHEHWSEVNLKAVFEAIISDLSARWDQVADPANALYGPRHTLQQFLRWALTGGRPGPGLVFTISTLGKEVSLQRIKDAAVSLDMLLGKTE